MAEAAPTIESRTRLPELLAPAGDWECARAAVENGADAIYFGLDRFNARMRAKNFTEADLPALMEFLHRRGVRGYVTFNTLIFPDELVVATDYLRSIIGAGVDAAIVQDVGIVRLIRQLSPDFPIHASTQMTITSGAGVGFARELGCNLVVLARENSLKDLEQISKCEVRGANETGAADVANSQLSTLNSQLPFEVFVHGALCVAYSGQCLTSEALGGRSANRGECAQACRMPYELVSDGQTVPLGDRRYLLSPQDLAGLEVLPELVRLGIASLKIEGRLKSPEYVASITRVYRKALDELEMRNAECGMRKLNPTPGAPSLEGATRNSEPGVRISEPGTFSRPSPLAPQTSYELEMAFSRGLHTGWFRGIDNQALVHARFGKKRGVFLGEVKGVEGESVLLRLEGPLKLGDGVVFDAGRPEEPEEGGRIYGMREAGRSPHAVMALTFGHGAVNFRRIQPGDRVWKTDDPILDRELRRTFEGDAPNHTRPITVEVHGHAGAPLTLMLRDELGHVVQLDSTPALQVAERRPLTDERLREQLGRLGGTPFHLGELQNRLEGPVILPVSELNRLRREALVQLEARRAQSKRWTINQVPSSGFRVPPSEFRVPGSGFRVSGSATPASIDSMSPGPLPDPKSQAELIVLVRSLAQLDAALAAGVATIYCEFEDPKKYREAVVRFRATQNASSALRTPHSAIFVAPPRITKPGEEWILKQVRSSEADGYLVRNYDHLRFFADCRRRGDYSLNVANSLAADWFVMHHGLERVTASYDLNVTQLESLLGSAPPAWFEVTLHQHMPMFHMEHCVFCAFLSKGTDYTNCGRPCDHHDVKLRDRVGLEHPLKADAGCRNTVFNARAQTGAESAARMMALGARAFRIEFLNETPDEVMATIARYRALLRGEISGTQLWKELKLHNQLGVTRGQLEQSGARKVFPKAG